MNKLNNHFSLDTEDVNAKNSVCDEFFGSLAAQEPVRTPTRIANQCRDQVSPQAPVRNPYAAAKSTACSGDDPSSGNPGLIQLLFSFQGRIPRSTYWCVCLSSGLLFGFIVGLSWLFFEAGRPSEVGMFLILSGFVVQFAITLAATAKRWHDRNKSARWLMLKLLPYVGPIWELIECGFLRGTEGENEYGPDPLQ